MTWPRRVAYDDVTPGVCDPSDPRRVPPRAVPAPGRRAYLSLSRHRT